MLRQRVQIRSCLDDGIMHELMRVHKRIEILLDLVRLEPFVVGRIEEGFNTGPATRRKRRVDEGEVELSEHGLGPALDLFPEDFSTCPETMEAEDSGFPLELNFHLSFLGLG